MRCTVRSFSQNSRATTDVLSDRDRSDLREVLRRNYFSQPLNYFSGTPDEYLASGEGQADMANHLERRTNSDRQIVIPWLDSVCQLQGCRVLEIGCGTGASTIALAEQGCDVTAVDVNEGNLLAAQERCRIHGLSAKFLCANATELQKQFPLGTFDLIVFFATLEHLTYAERMPAMKGTWAMLKPGGLWGVVETPNRLASTSRNRCANADGLRLTCSARSATVSGSDKCPRTYSRTVETGLLADSAAAIFSSRAYCSRCRTRYTISRKYMGASTRRSAPVSMECRKRSTAPASS